MSTILSGFGKRVGFTTLFKRPSYELKVSVTGPAKRYHQRNAATLSGMSLAMREGQLA